MAAPFSFSISPLDDDAIDPHGHCNSKAWPIEKPRKKLIEFSFCGLAGAVEWSWRRSTVASASTTRWRTGWNWWPARCCPKSAPNSSAPTSRANSSTEHLKMNSNDDKINEQADRKRRNGIGGAAHSAFVCLFVCWGFFSVLAKTIRLKKIRPSAFGGSVLYLFSPSCVCLYMSHWVPLFFWRRKYIK